MFGVVQFQDTLFTKSGLVNQTKQTVFQQVQIHADNHSMDDGKTWKRYIARNPLLSYIPEFGSTKKFLINPIIASNKVTYQINKAYLD